MDQAQIYEIIKINKDSSLPEADQLARQLIWLMADGVIKEGEKLPTIRVFADQLNIHHHTVRAAYHKLEEKALVSIKPRIGTIVRKYIPFLMYQQREYFQADMVGVLIPGLTDFYQQILSGIESVARDKRLIPIILNCDDDPVYAEVLYKNLSARNILGVINISLGFSDSYYDEFTHSENLNVPLVFLDVMQSQTHRINIDTLSAIRLATEHLLDHQYNDITLINCRAEWPIGREAQKGFRLAIESRGLEFYRSSVYSVPDFGVDAGKFAVKRIMNAGKHPRAIIAVSDSLAIGAMSALKEMDFKIPTDVAVMGFNNIFSASIVDPPLSTIGLPLFEMGKQAMIALNRVLDGDVSGWIHKEFSGKLVIRESCGCPAEVTQREEK